MNRSSHSRFAQAAPRAWHVAAAGALFAILFAHAGAVAAQTRVAKVTAVTPHASVPAPLTGTPASIAPEDSRAETLGPGDQVKITVFRNPDLTTETRISEGGTVTFPLLGEVSLKGLTPAQAGSRIAEKLKHGKFVVNPEVTVAAVQTNSRQVSVLGSVNKPGRYPLDSATGKVTDLLALAGGIAPGGSDVVTLVTTRNGASTTQEIDLPAIVAGDMSRNVELHAGDTIYVGRAPMVYIYGEVQKAGAYRVEKNMTVMQVLAMGGGLTPRGTQRGIRIERKGEDGNTHRMSANLTDRVKSDDVIYVQESLF
jgi:polysaccharide export outer membrane protein